MKPKPGNLRLARMISEKLSGKLDHYIDYARVKRVMQRPGDPCGPMNGIPQGFIEDLIAREVEPLIGTPPSPSLAGLEQLAREVAEKIATGFFGHLSNPQQIQGVTNRLAAIITEVLRGSEGAEVAKLQAVIRGLLAKLDSDISCAYISRAYCKEANAKECAYHTAVAALTPNTPDEANNFTEET